MSVCFACTNLKYHNSDRVERNDLPAGVIAFIHNAFPDAHSTRWSQVDASEGIILLAEVEQHNATYEVTFSPTGDFLNLYQPLSLKELDPELESVVAASARKHKVVQFGKMLLGNAQCASSYLLEVEQDCELIVRYQLIARLKTKGKPHLYQFNFTENGELESKEKVLK
jgi:hypothetical protein